jgi:hypothetical protein
MTGKVAQTHERPAGFAGRIFAEKNGQRQEKITKRWSYFDAVVLFSMFTTCTRRLASAIGWFGSLSLLLP